MDLTEKFARYPAVVRAALIGAVVGFVAYFAPAFVGSGDTLTQSILLGKVPLHALGLVFILRFLLGPWCYAAETPGGMFAPLLLVGTAFGALYGGVLHHFHLSLRATQVEFAIVGIAILGPAQSVTSTQTEISPVFINASINRASLTVQRVQRREFQLTIPLARRVGLFIID